MPKQERERSRAILDKLYGPEVRTIWQDQVPSSSDVSEWLRKQRQTWSCRPLNPELRHHEISAWARLQGLKQIDWTYEPKQNIWFRDPQVAMIWDLSKPK